MNEDSQDQGQWGGYPHELAAAHAALLDASRVPVHVAARRGVRSITTKKEARELGLRGEAERAGLWLPRWTTRGDNHGGQLRSDDPRLDVDGHVVKYETPSKQPAELDIHPDSRALLRDPAVPLVITEGCRKSDSCWGNFAIPAVSLAGVWSWRGTDVATGGVLALAAWEDIAFRSATEGRSVYVVFDSDVITKRPVMVACERLGAFLEARGAAVLFVILPDGEHGIKTGLDDFIAGGARWADIQGLAIPKLPTSIATGVTEEDEDEDTFDDVAEESGAGLLDDLVAFIKRFLILAAADHAWALALWSLHTHALSSFSITPRLHVTSPEKRSGKSRVIEVLYCLTARPEMALLPSASVIFRLTDATCPTWLLDEVDQLLAAGEEAKAALLAIINGGYRRGATVPKNEKVGDRWEPVRFRVFSPVALSGIGDLPDTTADRSIAIGMVRKLGGERTERFHIERTFAEAASLRRRQAAWAKRRLAALADAIPALPESLDDRAGEVWEPLLAIANEAGGEWPDRGWGAAEFLSGPDRDSPDSDRIRLLSDLRDLWDDSERKWEERVPTHTILAGLWRLEEAGWNKCQAGLPLDASGLARLLRHFGVKSTKQRMGDDSASVRGYLRSGFEPVWERYLASDHPPRNSRDTRNDEHTPWPGDMSDVPPGPPVPGGTGQDESVHPSGADDEDPLRWGPNGEVDL